MDANLYILSSIPKPYLYWNQQEHALCLPVKYKVVHFARFSYLFPRRPFTIISQLTDTCFEGNN